MLERCEINTKTCCALVCNCDFNCCDEDITTINNFINIIKQKWAIKIINVLNKQQTGFNELHNILKDCTKKVLTESLNNLIAQNVVEKRMVVKNNVHYSEYNLTQVGSELVNLLFDIKKFSCAYLNE
ncbi:winged helix-turn-helix transcriptional regulator [Spiroplasma sp. DGKH1]|uniref:winged helix-turn-helix transcriptional regulator n=1 Tax=Spiroplasma sp. DGKH1 TaxID=3050074 RepID=UPI0034C5E1A5